MEARHGLSCLPMNAHSCPAEKHQLFATIHKQQEIPLAGLDPWAFSPRTYPWASTSSWALMISTAKTWMPGPNPGKEHSQLHNSPEMGLRLDRMHDRLDRIERRLDLGAA
jgi:hypothetical protein